MYKLEVENRLGHKLELTNNESKYQIIRIDGLTPPKAQIYTNSIANLPGERFKHSKIEMRNIVINLRINGDVERNRIELYNYFAPSKWCKLYFKNETRKVYIDGYVETMEADLFVINETVQVSIVCPNPFFKSVDMVGSDLTFVSNGFEFPFAIPSYGIEFSTILDNKVSVLINRGDVEAGIIIEISTAYIPITNPVIYNYETGEFLKINATVGRGERIIVNTTKGEKSIIRKSNSGTETNIMNSLDLNSSTWLQSSPGVNYFTFSADSGAEMLNVYISQNLLYLGV